MNKQWVIDEQITPFGPYSEINIKVKEPISINASKLIFDEIKDNFSHRLLIFRKFYFNDDFMSKNCLLYNPENNIYGAEQMFRHKLENPSIDALAIVFQPNLEEEQKEELENKLNQYVCL